MGGARHQAGRKGCGERRFPSASVTAATVEGATEARAEAADSGDGGAAAGSHGGDATVEDSGKEAVGD